MTDSDGNDLPPAVAAGEGAAVREGVTGSAVGESGGKTVWVFKLVADGDGVSDESGVAIEVVTSVDEGLVADSVGDAAGGVSLSSGAVIKVGEAVSVCVGAGVVGEGVTVP